jgi:ketosteroid isomerase-like protein
VASPNVELARSIFEAWEHGDFSSAGWAHSDIEFVIADGTEQQTWTGLEGMALGWRGFLTAWQDVAVVADEFRELDDGGVLVLAHFEGRGKVSGLDMAAADAKGANLFHMRDGKVAKLVVWGERRRALAELGVATAPD